jgi:hypothetical protein
LTICSTASVSDASALSHIEKREAAMLPVFLAHGGQGKRGGVIQHMQQHWQQQPT